MEVAMRNAWLGFSSDSRRYEVETLVGMLSPTASVTFVRSAAELRERSRREMPQGVVVGPGGSEISDINVAAAIARDGAARSVYLVASSPSGSLLSRANIAGIDEVLDLSCLPAGTRVPQVESCAREADGSGGTRVPGGSPGVVPDFGGDIDEPELEPDFIPTTLVGEKLACPLGLPQVTSASEPPGARGGGCGKPVPADIQPPSGAMTSRIRPVPSPKGSEGRTPILTFVSGRGGVGKTTLVATCACVAASWGLNVALCDLDLSFGNLYACFGMRGPADLTPVSEMAELEDDLVERLGAEACDGVRLWGGCERPEMAEVVMPHVSGILEALAQSHDLVLVDTSATFTDAVAQAAQSADRLLITVDEGPGSPAAQARLGSLAVRLGVARTRIVRVANRTNPKRRGVPVINRAEVGLETARTFCVVDGGEEVREFVGAGEVRQLSETKCEYVAGVSELLALLLGELGCLPEGAGTGTAGAGDEKRHRWVFGRRKEAV